MFKNFSSAVEKAVSGAVQGILGEEFTKHYETPKDCTASGGHELCWKIFPAISKKNNQEVSVFVFDKDDLKKIKTKDNQERYLEVLRQEIKTLRLLRHPKVLKVEEVFEESRRTLSFVTERVTCSLSNACKNFTNVANVTPEVLEIGLTEFEIACGLMHVGEALSFLHREGRRVHLSLGPHSIFITPKGEWKLGGMGFCRVVEPGQTSRSEYFALDGSNGAKNPTTGVFEGSTEPPLQYCAPELVTEPRLFSSAADMFSLGLIVYELFCAPRADGGRNPVLDVQDGNKMTHGYKVQSLHPISFPPCVPVSLHNTIRSLLALQSTQRPEARTFLASQFFDSGPIKTLRTLQGLVEQDPAAQAKFLTSLPEAIDGFSTRTLRDMVLPGLQAVVINKQVAPFVITPLLKIVAKVDKITFGHSIAPMMIPLLNITEPVQCMLMFVSELETLIPKAEDGYIRDHIVPMLCRSLDSTVPEILDTVLNKIADQASLFEYRILKQVILPRVNKLILQPPQASVRVNALLWLAKSFHVFDKDLLIESVLPTLAETIQQDKTPAVCMCILGCYDNLGKHLGPEFVAKLIIPAVAPLLWEKTLNSSQFDCVCEKIQDMLKAVIQERDQVFQAESHVKTVNSGITAASGLSVAVNAADANKEQTSGLAAANAMLQEGYDPSKRQPHAEAPHANPYGNSGATSSSNPNTNDPFYLGSSSASRTQTSNSSASSSRSQDKSGDRADTFSSRRRAKKASRRKSGAGGDDNDSDLLDIPSSQGTGTNELLSMSGVGSTLPSTQAPASSGGGNLFNGMNMGGSYGGNQQPQQQTNAYQGNQMVQAGQFYGNNPPQQMNAFNMQQQPQQMQYGNMGMNNMGGMGGIGNMGGMNGINNMGNMAGMGMQQQQFGVFNPQQQHGGGLSGPGQMLQLQAGPGQYQQNQRGMGADKFSAFDGI